MTQQIGEGARRGLPLPGGQAYGLSAGANSKDGAIVRQNLINHRSSPGRTSSSSPACLLPGKSAVGRSPSPFLLPQQLLRNRRENTAVSFATASTTATESSDAVIEPSRETTDADGRSQAQSFTGPSSISRISNDSRENGIGGRQRGVGDRKCPHAWEARSRLPFHMLPFEVQAYHLQQHHHHNQHSHNLRYAEVRSKASRADNHFEEDGANSSDPVAIAESAWFPLMPPALAGEALPSAGFAPSNKHEPLLLGQKKSSGNITGRQQLEISTARVSRFFTAAHNSTSTGRSVDDTTNAAGESARSSTVVEKEEEEEGDTVEAKTTEKTGKEEPASPGPASREAPSGRRSRQRASDSDNFVNNSSSSSSNNYNCRLAPPRSFFPSSASTKPLEERNNSNSSRVNSRPTSAADKAAGGVDPMAEVRMSVMALVATSGFVEATRMVELCLDLGNTCRERISWSFRVTDLTPQRLMEHLWPLRSIASAEALGRDPLGWSRLRRRRFIERVRVEVDRAVTGADWPAAMKELRFGDSFNHPVEGVALPDGVRVLSFGVRFNQPVSRVRWPAELEELAFGNDFNQPISGIVLPAGLRRLDLGGRFNFAVSAVDWPEGLRELRFGHGFNREIASVRWPQRLQEIEFCGELQQRIEDVVWPRRLEHLALLGDFNQPVDAVDWPPSLRSIRFGDGFRQPLVKIRWPPLLERVVLGRDFDKPLNECMWPLGLKELTVPVRTIAYARGKGMVACSGIPEACEIKVLLDDRSVLGEEDCGRGMEIVGRQSSYKLARVLESAAAAAGGKEGVGVSVVDSGEVFDDEYDDLDSLGCWDGDDVAGLAGDDGGGVGSFGGVVDVFGYEPDAWEVEGVYDLRGQFVL